MSVLASFACMVALSDQPPMPATDATTRGAATLKMGHLTLHRCRSGAWCGILPRALDPAGEVRGTVPIYFEFYPHSALSPAVGTLVAAGISLLVLGALAWLSVRWKSHRAS